MEVLVDKRSAYKMNNGQDKLYDILVLHLDGGKDIFITVTGRAIKYINKYLSLNPLKHSDIYFILFLNKIS